MTDSKSNDAVILQERITLDTALLASLRTFNNGCNFRLLMNEGKPYLEYGCYGVHKNLTQGKERLLMRWLGVGDECEEPKYLPISQETLAEALKREPCKKCGGARFKSASNDSRLNTAYIDARDLLGE